MSTADLGFQAKPWLVLKKADKKRKQLIQLYLVAIMR